MKTLTSAWRALLVLSIPFQVGATTITIDLGGIGCAPAALCSAQPGATTVSFDGLTGATPSPYSFGGATYSWVAANAPFAQGSLAGNYGAPVNDTTEYLTVGSPNRPNTVTINFADPITYFGLYMGSPDAYNSISFYGPGNSPITSFTGTQMYNVDVGSWTSGNFVNFRISGGTVAKIVMSSPTPAFETDNHAFTAIPEPGTVGLMFAALAAVFVGRKSYRRTNS